MNRRGFITGLVSLIAAPAIVRAGSLMAVRGEPLLDLRIIGYEGYGEAVRLDVLYGSLRLGDILTFGSSSPRCDVFSRQFVVTAIPQSCGKPLGLVPAT